MTPGPPGGIYLAMQRYEITCLKCKKSDVITIDESRHQILRWDKMLATNFLAGRFRKDLQWGFECICGNDNRLAKEEKGEMAELVQGPPQTIKKIADSLKIPDAKQFTMARV